MRRHIPTAVAAAAASLLLSRATFAVELYNNGTFVTGQSPLGNTISAVPPGYDTFGLVAAGYNTVAPQRVADNFLILAGGWAWLAFATGSAARAFQLGVAPFLVGDVLKIALAASLLPAGWALLRRRPGGKRK